MDLQKLQRDISKFVYEISNEDRLVRVGLKDKLEIARIYKKYSYLFTNENLELVDRLKTKGFEEEIRQRIYYVLASSFIEQSLAVRQDKLTTFYSNASVDFEGQKLAFYNIAPLITKDPIFARREKLDDLAIKVIDQAKLRELEILQAEIKGIKTIGFEGYLDFTKKSKNVDYGNFEKVVQKILKETDAVWFKNMEATSLSVFKKPFKKIRSCHLLYLRGIGAYDNYYPKEKLVPTFEGFVKDMGLLELLKSVQIDDADRPRKNPRAVCYWADPPKEVHLVIKPLGGEQDYEALFHEGGHALHAASENASAPYAFRDLSRSNALTEAYAYILEDLVFEPAWLSRYLNVSSHTGNKILHDATFVNLMLLRRYLGKFLYEYEVFSENKQSRAPGIYVKRLGETTGFVYQKEKYLYDMDGHFYSADYLRAWIGSAQIKDYLRKKFGREWFFNQKAGKFLRELWSDGVKYELEEVVSRLGYKPWDTAFLISNYKEIVS